jgi:hypothetical protein
MDIEWLDEDLREDLPPPPRRVPARLRFQILTSGRALLIGSLLFGVGAIEAGCLRSARVQQGLPRRESSASLAFPSALVTIGILLAVPSLAEGQRRVELLSHGLLAQGRITSVQELGGNSGREVAFQDMASRLAKERPGAPVAWGGLLWTAGAIIALVMTLTACGVLLRIALTGSLPLELFGRPIGRWPGVVFILACGAGACGLCTVLIVQGGRWVSIPLGENRGAVATRRLRCRFEFRIPSGKVVRTADRATFIAGSSIPAVQPVLYDPKILRSALLLAGTDPLVGITPSGNWEAVHGSVRRARAALLAACWIGAPCAGGIIAWCA